MIKRGITDLFYSSKKCKENKSLTEFNRKIFVLLIKNKFINILKKEVDYYNNEKIITCYNSILHKKENNKILFFNIKRLYSNVSKNLTKNKKTRISFEEIVKILKSLKNKNFIYEEKNMEKKMNFLLPHIYEECKKNYVHFSCILYNFHKLRNNFSKEYKVKIYNEFNNIFLYNINLFSLKELTIILKCLLEENNMNINNIVLFCYYKFIYYISIDILHKKNDIFYSIFFSVLNDNFKEHAHNFFVLNINTINKDSDINYFYDLVYNLNQHKIVKINYFKSKLSKYSNNFFNLHDVSSFMSLLKNYNLKLLSFYAFLSHLCISSRYFDMPNHFQEQLEQNFLMYEKNGNFTFSQNKSYNKLKKNKEINERTDEELFEKKKDEIIRDDKLYEKESEKVTKVELVRYFINMDNREYIPLSSICNKENLNINENILHSISSIIFISIKRKLKNKFIYILTNHLLLKYINYINLIDICNILDLFIYDAKNLKKQYTIFSKMKNLIIKETNIKTFAIFCISIMKIKKELNNYFTDIIISIYKIILNKENNKNKFIRENVVIFINISNFLSDKKISTLFYLYYLNKFKNFLNFLIVKNRTNSCNLFLNIIDIYDILKTSITIFKIYEINNFSLKKKINPYLSSLLIYILKFLEDLCFKKIILHEDDFFYFLRPNLNDFNKLKVLNKICYYLNLLFPIVKNLRTRNIADNKTVQQFSNILCSFKNSIYKNYEITLFNNKKNKNYTNILNFIFITDGYS
ncbi:conserved Plasmodium protein, unknown function [Plasmodium gallinaceum]|uniref:Uncharacterized protein n=1 Tax=Plasmodium gallinaceum TaxID=5849 RepID=A0A1J1GND2_PLAGA|nr:conserved Plasmodium protein, unknown function [Plasmodium gallinaceum]CRG93781.1 conserved Plasmodium protein, unknown function [Plasmodium gallinaceum]